MTARARRRRYRHILLGIVGIALGISATTLAFLSTQGLPFAARTTLKAAFVDIGSLRAGDDVRIANVRVGYVERVVLEESVNPASGSSKQPVAVLKLDDARPVYRNAQAVTASVGARSALGQKFVELNPGDPSAGLLPDGSLIPATQTSGAQELSDVLAVLDLPTRQATGSFVRNFGGGLIGHGGDLNDGLKALPDMLPDLALVSESLSQDNGRDLRAMLTNLNSLSGSFAGRQEAIGQLVGKLDKTFAAVNTDGGQPLAETLRLAPGTLRDARGALRSLNAPLADTASTMRELRPGGEALGRATPDVRGVLRDGRPPLDKVPGVSDDAQPALVDLRDLVSDARPLAPMLTKTFARGGSLTQVVSPFSPEMVQFFTNAADALQNGNDNYHWLRFVASVAHGETALGTLPVRTPLNARDQYPAPGESAKQATGLPGVNGGVLGR